MAEVGAYVSMAEKHGRGAPLADPTHATAGHAGGKGGLGWTGRWHAAMKLRRQSPPCWRLREAVSPAHPVSSAHIAAFSCDHRPAYIAGRLASCLAPQAAHFARCQARACFWLCTIRLHCPLSAYLRASAGFKPVSKL